MPSHAHRPRFTSLKRAVVVAAVGVGILAPAMSAEATTATTTTTKTATTSSTIVRSTFGVRVVAEAARHYGAPYQWGAVGPHRFDCSGLTVYVFHKLGVRLPRTAAAQYRAVRHVSHSSVRVGDLIFKYNSSGYVYHVGIYAGHGMMWNATHTGDIVRKSRVSGRYHVGRVR